MTAMHNRKLSGALRRNALVVLTSLSVLGSVSCACRNVSDRGPCPVMEEVLIEKIERGEIDSDAEEYMGAIENHCGE